MCLPHEATEVVNAAADPFSRVDSWRHPLQDNKSPIFCARGSAGGGGGGVRPGGGRHCLGFRGWPGWDRHTFTAPPHAAILPSSQQHERSFLGTNWGNFCIMKHNMCSVVLTAAWTVVALGWAAGHGTLFMCWGGRGGGVLASTVHQVLSRKRSQPFGVCRRRNMVSEHGAGGMHGLSRVRGWSTRPPV